MFEFRIKKIDKKPNYLVLEYAETYDKIFMKDAGSFFWAYYKLYERDKHKMSF